MPDKLLLIFCGGGGDGPTPDWKGPRSGLPPGNGGGRGSPGTLESRDFIGTGAGLSRATRGLQGRLASIKQFVFLPMCAIIKVWGLLKK